MAMNRRNVLVGLGAIAAGGGAVLGTGAFSQVEAQRTVAMNTETDSNANVELNVVTDSAAITDSGGTNTIGITGEGLNFDAVTDVTGVLEITVSSSASSDYQVDILDSPDGSSITVATADDSEGATDMQFVSNPSASAADATGDSDGSFSTVSPSETVVYDITFNLLGDTQSGDITLPGSGEITIQVT